MKRLLLILILLSNNLCFAYNFSEEEKNIFYDSFIEGYIEKVKTTILNSDLEQTKKDTFLKEFIKMIDKNELQTSSWECIKKYDIKNIVEGAVVCTESWSQQQNKKNKKLLESIK